MQADQVANAALAEHGGLNIDPAPDTGGGEGEPSLTAQDILDKIRQAVGDQAISGYRVVAKPNGGFIVYCQKAQNIFYDVSGDGIAAPVDALIVINFLNAFGSAPLAEYPLASDVLMDKDGDDYIAPSDALAIINYLNSVAATHAGGEGERVAAPLVNSDLTWLATSPFSFAQTSGGTPLVQPVLVLNSSPSANRQSDPPAAMTSANDKWAQQVTSVFSLAAKERMEEPVDWWLENWTPGPHPHKVRPG